MNFRFIIKFGPFLLALLFGAIVVPYWHVSRAEEVNLVQEEEELLLFVEEGCPHCRKVEEFITENSLDDKVDIRDIRADSGDAALYNEMCDEAGIPLTERGFPLLFEGESFYQGSEEIIKHFGGKFAIPVDDYIDDTQDSDQENSEEIDNYSDNVVIAILGIGVLISLIFLFLYSKGKK